MIEVCLIKDLLFSVFSEAASAPFIPEAVNLIVTAAHELCGMIHGFGAELSVWKDLPWRSLLETSICNGWSFNNFSRISLVSWGKRREEESRDTLEGELGCLPLPFSLMFEILFMSYRVLRLGGIEYTVREYKMWLITRTWERLEYRG